MCHAHDAWPLGDHTYPHSIADRVPSATHLATDIELAARCSDHQQGLARLRTGIYIQLVSVEAYPSIWSPRWSTYVSVIRVSEPANRNAARGLGTTFARWPRFWGHCTA